MEEIALLKAELVWSLGSVVMESANDLLRRLNGGWWLGEGGDGSGYLGGVEVLLVIERAS